MSLELVAGAEVANTYTLTRCIGEGGMGQVWAATRIDSGDKVALKFIKGDEVTPTARRRFFREARAATAIQHPSVVKIHEILKLDDDIPVLVMDYLPGESLEQKLDRELTIGLRELAAIMQPVVSAVGTAHALGIVHRDLKPANIFLAKGSDGPIEVKVLDFGIAKLTAVDGSLEASTSLTGTGSLLGTPYYMAPEQICGEKDIDHHADIWALGVILYEALSGVLPTDGDNVGQVFKIVVTSTLPPLEEVAPELPEAITRLVTRMLSRRVIDRPSDLREVWRALKRYTDSTTAAFEAPSSLRPDPTSAPVRVGGGVKVSIADEDTEIDPSSSRAADGADSSPEPASARTMPDEVEGDTLPASDQHPTPGPSPEGSPEGSPKRSLAGFAAAAGAIAIAGAWWLSSAEPTTALAGGAAHVAATVAGSLEAGNGDPAADPPLQNGTNPDGDPSGASDGGTAPASAPARPAASGLVARSDHQTAPLNPTRSPPQSPTGAPPSTAAPAAPATASGAPPKATSSMPNVQDWPD